MFLWETGSIICIRSRDLWCVCSVFFVAHFANTNCECVQKKPAKQMNKRYAIWNKTLSRTHTFNCCCVFGHSLCGILANRWRCIKIQNQMPSALWYVVSFDPPNHSNAKKECYEFIVNLHALLLHFFCFCCSFIFILYFILFKMSRNIELCCLLLSSDKNKV